MWQILLNHLYVPLIWLYMWFLHEAWHVAKCDGLRYFYSTADVNTCCCLMVCFTVTILHVKGSQVLFSSYFLFTESIDFYFFSFFVFFAPNNDAADFKCHSRLD